RLQATPAHSRRRRPLAGRAGGVHERGAARVTIAATVAHVFQDNPLLLLFAVVAVGYPLGRIRVGGFSLGVAGVLFAGLAAGALHSNLELPELIYQLGLVLFVYTIGLANGP